MVLIFFLQLISRFFICLLTIGFFKICFQYLIYFQLVFLKFLLVYLCVHLQLVYLCDHFQLVSWCTYIDIFFIGIMFVLISPLEVIFCFRQKGEEYVFLWPLCWWLTKRGRSIWVICMFYMHVFILVSRSLFLCFIDIGIKSMNTSI